MDPLGDFRRIGQGFCGTVWATEGGITAMKREDGGPGRSVLIDYTMHKLVLKTVSQEQEETTKSNVCVPQWPKYVKKDDPWWDANLSRFPLGYTACNLLVSERIPPLPQEVRDCLVDHYCPAASIATIKSNDADRDCLVRLYLGRRKIQNKARSGRNFFSLRNYPLHLNQAEELGLRILEYARAMAEMLAAMHWTAKIDANDVELVLGGTREENANGSEFVNGSLGTHSLWILDFDCCKPLAMDDTGVEQAAQAFLRNDPYFPRPAMGTSDHGLWLGFRSRYLECGQSRSAEPRLPEKFIARVEELHEQSLIKRLSEPTS